MQWKGKQALVIAAAALAVVAGTGGAIAATGSTQTAAVVTANGAVCAGPHGPGFAEAAASYLGLTTAELRTQLESGKSLADVAKAQGKSVDGLKAAILADAKSHVAQAVKDGRLTQAQADARLADLTSHLDDIVNRTGPPGPPLPGA